MKGLERITNLRLAEVLTQNGLLTREEMGEAISIHESSGERFVSVLVQTGYVTEWDLAKVVAESFQLPFLLGERYETPKEIIDLFEEDFLFQHLVVPVDQFGKVLTVRMPVFVPGDVLEEIQEKKGVDVFPVVGLISENQKLLFSLFPDHPKEEPKAPVPPENKIGGDWETIFDIGDQAVKKDLQG